MANSTQVPTQRPWLLNLHRIFLIASFATWFGGFGFYVSIVVPIGTDVLGSPFAQGMITRQVTHWLNLFSGIAFASMLLESAVSWRKSTAWLRWSQLGLCVTMIASLIALVLLHPALDAMIDFEASSVSDSDQFYDLHRIYLWTSTLQWFAAWVWLILLVSSWGRRA